jgi:hypothetical protein
MSAGGERRLAHPQHFGVGGGGLPLAELGDASSAQPGRHNSVFSELA